MMTRKPVDAPRERHQTLRQAILQHLEEGPLTARDLSALVQIREKEVIPHLEHLERSLRRSGRRLAFEPAECLSCGYGFKQRRRLSKPSACPRCRAERIAPPVFRLDSRG
jgi:predicted Zn-ribbon and HTH transcriptional regulator